MQKLEVLKNRVLPLLAVGLLALLVVWVVLAPAEATLGNVVKLVYVHGALVWVGLLTFTLAGVLGLVALLVRRAIWYEGAAAAGAGALWIWVIYTISSMAVTALTWGQLIAWNEPRVRATGLILLAALLLAIVARLVGHRDFSAAMNVVMGIVPWVLVQRAEAIRHPIDPIGGSGSTAIQTFYLLMVLTVAGLALVLVAWLWTGRVLKEDK